MSMQLFWTELAKLRKNRFILLDNDSIRTKDGVCPVSAVANKLLGKRKFESAEYQDAGKYLKMSETQMKNLGYASDYIYVSGILGKYRKKLLKVLNLHEVSNEN